MEGFRSLVEQKDKEIITIHESQVSKLQDQILEQKKDFLALETLYLQLQEDFKYNLKLLDDRDVELERFDSLSESFQDSLKEKDSMLEELRSAMSKVMEDHMKEKEEAKNNQKSLLQTIQTLKQELEAVQDENDKKYKKQEKKFRSSKEAMKTELMVKEAELYQLKKFQEEHLQSLEKQIMLYQWDSDMVQTKVQDMEAKCMQLGEKSGVRRLEKLQMHEKDVQNSLDDKARRIEELTSDIRKIVIDEDNLQTLYEQNIRRLRYDANNARKEYLKCISKEAEKVNRSITFVQSAEARLHELETEISNRLHSLSSKVLTMEQDLSDLKVCESRNNQIIEKNYSEMLRLHEIHLKEAKHEALKWKAEYDRLQMKCLDLEKMTLQNKNLEAENSRLQQNMLELKDQNEKIQDVVAMLRSEMEALQDATIMEDTKEKKRYISGKKHEDEVEKDLREELSILKQRISKISFKLDGIHASVPLRKDTVNSLEAQEKTLDLHDFSDEKLSAKIMELEQTQVKLKAQLEATLANAARIADERDLLMSLNNSLHAEMNRIMESGCMDQHHGLIGNKDKVSRFCCQGQVQSQSNQMMTSHCCTIWNRCNEADSQKQCCSNSKTHGIQVNERKSSLHVEGNGAKYHDRATADDVTHKGTSSQHVRLRSLVKKHEEVQNRPKVRNYNIKDDDMCV